MLIKKIFFVFCFLLFQTQLKAAELPFQGCVVSAAQELQVPIELINAILKVEGGRVGTKSANSNGTYDYGPMQINTIWLKKFKPYGITEKQLTWDACTNIRVGTWILKSEIVRVDDFWKGVGNYHSKTPKYHDRYLSKVVRAIQQSRRVAMNGTR